MTKKLSARARGIIKYSLGIMVLSMTLVLAPVAADNLALNRAEAGSWWQTANEGGLDIVGGAYGQSGVDSASNDIRVVIARIIRRILELLGLLFLVLIIVAGFRWMTAGGEEDKVETAKKQLTNSVIGLFIVLGAWAIATFVLNQMIYMLTGVMPVSWSW